MKYYDISKGELVDPDTQTLGEKFSIAGMDRDLNIQTAGLAEEYYGPQKLDWMENYPDLEWEEYLRYKSSGSFNQGGRVGFDIGGDVKKITSLRKKGWTADQIANEFGKSRSWVERFVNKHNLPEQKKRLGGKPKGFTGVPIERGNQWLINYSRADLAKDLKAGKTLNEIAENLYAKNKFQYDQLPLRTHTYKTSIYKQTPVAHILEALSKQIKTTGSLEGYNPTKLKENKVLRKLADQNQAKYDRTVKNIKTDIKNFIATKGAEYKKLYQTDKLTRKKFYDDIINMVEKKYPKFVKVSEGARYAGIAKGEKIIPIFHEAKGGQYGHKLAITEQIDKAIGNISTRKNLNPFRRIETLKKLLPLAQEQGLIDKTYTNKDGKKVKITPANYQYYVNKTLRDPLFEIFGKKIFWSPEHMGGVARAGLIDDAKALAHVTPMESGALNRLKGNRLDKVLTGILRNAVHKIDDGAFVRKQLAKANKLSKEAFDKYGVRQATYSYDAKNKKINTKYPNIKLSDSLLAKTKAAIHNFIANGSMKKPVFKQLPEKLQQGIRLINQGKNANTVLSSHLDDVIPNWKTSKGITLNNFAGAVDLDLLPPSVRNVVGKSVGALSKTLGALGGVALPFDMAISFATPASYGLGKKDVAAEGTKQVIENFLNIPRMVEDVFHVAGEGTWKDFGSKEKHITPEFEFARKSTMEKIKNTPIEELEANIDNLSLSEGYLKDKIGIVPEDLKVIDVETKNALKNQIRTLKFNLDEEGIEEEGIEEEGIEEDNWFMDRIVPKKEYDFSDGGRVNLQTGTMDFPLTNAMNNNQEEEETDIHNIIADIYDVNDDTYVREEDGPIKHYGRGDKNIAPLKYLLEGMEINEARAKVLAEEGRQKEKYREEGWNVDTWGKGGAEEFGSHLYSMFHPSGMKLGVMGALSGVARGVEWVPGQASQLFRKLVLQQKNEPWLYHLDDPERHKIFGLSKVSQFMRKLKTVAENEAKKEGLSPAAKRFGQVTELGAEIATPIVPPLKYYNHIKNHFKTTKDAQVIGDKITEQLEHKGFTRRDFLATMGTVGFLGALKVFGLDKVFKMTPVAKGNGFIKPLVGTTSKMPEWFPAFIAKLEKEGRFLYEGDGMFSFKAGDDLKGIDVIKEGDNYTVMGVNDYDQAWHVTYEHPHWIEVAQGEKAKFFKGDFSVNEARPRMVGPDDVDVDFDVIDSVDDILGGNGKLMEEYTTGTVKNVDKHGLTPGERQVNWAEGRADQAMEEAKLLDDTEPEFATGGRVSAQPPKSGPNSGGLPYLLNNVRNT